MKGELDHMPTSVMVPHDKALDNTLSLGREGYLFIRNRIDKLGSDIFETHVLGEKVICISGEEAAKLFYNPERFERNGAVPKRIQKTLFGMNAIQTLDDEAHNERKQLFMSLVAPWQEKRLAEIVSRNFQVSADKWKAEKQIVLFDELNNILCKSACQWAGIPLPEADIQDRAKDFSSMIDAFGGVGPRYWKGRTARSRTEEWLRKIIEDVHSGKLKTDEGSALNVMALHAQQNGLKLDVPMSAIELINAVRPIVAISFYITFAALAMHEHPEYAAQLKKGSDNYYRLFANEVRRYYPFTPLLGARVREDFLWKQCEFKKGMLVFLDIYGTNHDPRIWENPYKFQPDRFKEHSCTLFDFIPQGGGNPYKEHRCPGEGFTIAVMKVALDFLVNKIEYEVPEQNLSYSLSRIPTRPESGFIIKIR